MPEPKDYMSLKNGSAGQPAGIQFDSSVFFRAGQGPILTDANGKLWQLQLITNADGTVDSQWVQVVF